MDEMKEVLDIEEHFDLQGVATDPLCAMYLNPKQRGKTDYHSKLDVFLPLIPKAISEIYMRSDNPYFLHYMNQLTQRSNSAGIEQLLMEKLKTLMNPSAPNDVKIPDDSQSCSNSHTKSLNLHPYGTANQHVLSYNTSNSSAESSSRDQSDVTLCQFQDETQWISQMEQEMF